MAKNILTTIKQIAASYQHDHFANKHEGLWRECRTTSCLQGKRKFLKHLWNEACKWDNAKPDTAFIVFSENNPFTLEGEQPSLVVR